ncbi:MAG: hypothetical protein WDZ30_07025 [Cellvibrionaceae bacterium]
MFGKPLANVALTAVCLLLVACGGGSSGSQSPDPVVVDLPIAYIKRPLPVDEDDPTVLVPDNILEPAAFNPGAVLYVRERAAPGAREINVTDRAWPQGELYDVKDLEVSADGKKLIFAMRAPDDPNLNDDEQAKWDIWEYELATDTLRRIIVSDTIAQQNHDVAPHYLPGGRIVFSSDRQQRTRSILLDDGKPQYAGLHEGNLNNGDEPAFVLHAMDDDGTDIDQITYNQSHDLQPSILHDGRIIFLRWDRWNNNNLSLYTVRPDGSNLQHHYGFHSQATGPNNTVAVFSQPRQMPDNRILVLLRPREIDNFGGDIVLIDAENYTEIDQPTYPNRGANAPGQISASLLDVFIDDTISPHGYFSAFYPFFDDSDRLLVGWSQCRLVNPNNPQTFLPCTNSNLQDPDAEEANPAYGLWIYNPVAGTQLPVVPADGDIIYSDVAAMEPRDPPTFIQPLEISGDPTLLEEAVGVVHIRSVYDLDGEDATPDGIEVMRDPGQTDWADRPARFLRIKKAVSIPPEQLMDFDTAAYGVNGAGRSMREILGYVPIEPDGSVKFKVPADMAFTFSILDAEGRRLSGFQRHQNWLQVRAGEQMECNGCHTRGSELPHGRQNAQAPSINLGAPTSGGGAFPNTWRSASIGDTMAEAFGTRTPSTDVRFQDEWSLIPDPANNIDYRYADLQTNAPTLASCQLNWAATCRIMINYLDHIQPLWDLPRDTDGDDVPDAACVDCHGIVDDMGAAQVPAGQLELTNTTPSVLNTHPGANNLWNLSYRELFFNDAEVELVGGNLQRRRVIDSPAVLDPVTGDVIEPEQSHVPTCNPSMAGTGARNSSSARVSNVDCEALGSPRDFFSWFAPGAYHEGDLTDAELKLISEWLDIGAQYYNNPFDAPVN